MTTRSPTSSPSRLSTIGLVTALFLVLTAQVCSGAYYGKLIGKLSELHHGVSGEVYAVDGRTLFIKDFTYDGEGPAAFFYVGSSKSPSANGFRVRDERGTTNVLKRYRRKDITLTLPDGKTLNNIKWFSVWCDEFSVNFGDVKIQRGFDYPKPQKLAGLNGIHGVSSEPIVIVDAQTLLIPSFSYDGEAPDAKFWVGAGPSPSPQGIRVPDENGKVTPLHRYDHKTIVLTLPGDLTVHQLGHFGVWCEAFAVDFGHTQIPQDLNVPPSLKMLGVSPQSKLNCEVLEDSLAFEVRWAVAGDSIVVQLVAKLEDREYMAFGVSADLERSVMVGGDVAVARVDKHTLQGYATDYFLESKSQCSGGRGSCPDTRIQENTDSVQLLNAAIVNGYSIVTYQRPLKASDELDLPILTNVSQAIIWAIGPLNERNEVSFHTHYLKTDRLFEFSRPPAWNCPMPEQEQPQPFTDNDERESSNQELVVTTRRPQRLPATPAPAPKDDAWEIPPIQCYEPEDGVFYAQMGPTGGKHGYPAITGHVGWGISWYINGLLIPEINVVRGKKYTFVVEGGQNPDTPARYHPFYITDDPVGGYQHKTPEEKAKVKIFAGVRRQRGTVRPTGVGRLCNWVPDQNQPPADEFTSFGAYQRTLTLECDHGEPGIVEWTPDENTPDTVYYQCFTHRYLGWKINVLDSCDVAAASASENHEVYVELKPPSHTAVDLEGSPSIRVPSKVTPTAEFLQQHLHHPHRDYYYGDHRYYHHPPTNHGKLSAPHTQLLTNANNNNNHYDRLQLSSSSSSPYDDPYGSPRPSYAPVATPYRHEVRVKNANLDEEAFQQQQQQQVMTYAREPPSAPSEIRLRPGFSYAGPTGRPQQQQITETADPEVQQEPSNQQLSNLVADNPRPLSQHGAKYSYAPAGTQILYSRAPPHYASNHHHNIHHALLHHHHHHQPEQQRTQLMIVRRPVLMRRPLLQTTISTSSSSSGLPLPLPIPVPRPIFVERKKAVYRLPPRISEKSSHGANVQIAKLMKLDKQRAKIEAKVSDIEPGEISEAIMMGIMKPARNTGFDPDSIVIEGGFKPIIRNREQRPVNIVQERIDLHQDEIYGQNNTSYVTADSFEPVFVPSPPVNGRSEGIKQKQKKKTLITRNTKVPLDEIDDMEMAADRLEAYYLPPVANTKADELPLASSGVLVAFDGRKLKDSSLTRSIPSSEVERPRGRLTSDVLSKTPQFGKFKGELPPLISGEIRSLDSSHFDNRRPSTVDLPEGLSRRNTKLTLVGRLKRSAHEGHVISSTNFHGVENKTSHEGRGNQETFTLASASQMLLANIGYVVLTAVLYFII